MHLTDGELRAWHDREGEAPWLVQVEAHLAACQPCQVRAKRIEARGVHIAARLATLDPLPDVPFTEHQQALARFEARQAVQTKEQTMTTYQRVSRRMRPWLPAVAAVLALAVAFSLPPVRAAAWDILGLFRVRQVAVIPINPAKLPDTLGDSSGLEQMLSDDVRIQTSGEAHEAVDAADASEVAGFQVRLPAGMDMAPTLRVQPAVQATFDVDLPRVRTLLAAAERDDVRLPEALDGAQVRVDAQPAVLAAYGDCGELEEPDDGVQGFYSDCTLLVQLPSPTIEAPAELDVAAVGEAFLQLLGMSREEAARFSQTIDWSTTLVLPIPRYALDHEEIAVDGVTGVMLRKPGNEDRPETYMLIWVNDEIVYALTGKGNGAAGVTLANSMR